MAMLPVDGGLVHTIAQLFTMLVFQFVAYYRPRRVFMITQLPDSAHHAHACMFWHFGRIYGDIANNYVLAKMKVATGKNQLALRFAFPRSLAGMNTAVY